MWNILPLHHIFLFQDLVNLSRCGRPLKLLTLQQLILQLFNSLNKENPFMNGVFFFFRVAASGDCHTLPVLAKASPILRLRPP